MPPHTSDNIGRNISDNGASYCLTALHQPAHWNTMSLDIYYIYMYVTTLVKQTYKQQNIFTVVVGTTVSTAAVSTAVISRKLSTVFVFRC